MATLLHHWKLDEGTGQFAADSVTSANSNIYTSSSGDRGVTWETSGKNISAVIGDGTAGASYGVKTSASYSALPIDFTIMAWFKTSDHNVSNLIAGILISATPWFGHGMFLEPSEAGRSAVSGVVYAYPLGRYKVRTSTSIDVADNAFHHVALTLNSSTNALSIYLDCSLEDGETITIPPDFSAYSGDCDYWFCGGTDPVNYMSVSGAFNGVVDDVRVYDAAMTEEEICAAMVDFPASVTNALMFSCNT